MINVNEMQLKHKAVWQTKLHMCYISYGLRCVMQRYESTHAVDIDIYFASVTEKKTMCYYVLSSNFYFTYAVHARDEGFYVCKHVNDSFEVFDTKSTTC